MTNLFCVQKYSISSSDHHQGHSPLVTLVAVVVAGQYVPILMLHEQFSQARPFLHSGPTVYNLTVKTLTCSDSVFCLCPVGAGLTHTVGRRMGRLKPHRYCVTFISCVLYNVLTPTTHFIWPCCLARIFSAHTVGVCQSIMTRSSHGTL